jgi:peptide-methionine (S)-S-oxide reductase
MSAHRTLTALIAGLVSLPLITSCDAAPPVGVPAAAVSPAEPGTSAVAVLAGGCFWGMEAVFEEMKGVKSVVSGFAGGASTTATYDQVSTETTGHAEAVQIRYDPRVVSYATLLRVYFSVAHNPTERNRQGPDTGPSYRSAIFPQNALQRQIATAYIAQLDRAKIFPRAIVTRLESGRFFPAEAYHQDFARRNPNYGYIVRWDAPKIRALKVLFPQLVK